MTTQTSEQGRESLEELARQAIETPEEVKTIIPTLIAQNEAYLRKRGLLEPRTRSKDYKKFVEEEKVRYQYDEYSRFQKLVSDIANPNWCSQLLGKDRKSLLTFIKSRKGQGFFLEVYLLSRN